MKIRNGLILLILSLTSVYSQAAPIINGDFATCDYTGWQKDTDGFGDASSGNDFSIEANGADCSAAINVDHFDPAGDFTGLALDEVFFANTLFQELDLSAAGNSTFLLNIDFAVESEIDSTDPLYIADYFLFGLSNGSGSYFNQTGALGFLVGPTDIDGAFSQSLSIELDNSFVNQLGWSLELQVNVGVDNFGFSDAFGSSLLINSVSLTEIPSVSEPASAWVFSLGILGMFMRRKVGLSIK